MAWGDGGPGAGASPPTAPAPASAAVPAVAARTQLLGALCARNGADGGYRELVASHAASLALTLQLQTRLAATQRELALSRAEAAAALRRADRAEEAAARGAEAPALREKITSLQEELSGSYKSAAESTRGLLAARDAMAEAQAAAAVAATDRDEARGLLAAERRRAADLAADLAHQTAANAAAAGELDARKAERDAAVARAAALESENASLLQRWMDQKGAEAAKVNEANNIYDQMLRSARSVRSALETPLPSSFAAAFSGFGFSKPGAAAAGAGPGGPLPPEEPSVLSRLGALACAARPLPSAARHTLRGDAAGSLALAFSSSGATLASAGADRGCPVSLWEPQGGTSVGSLAGGGAVGAVLDLAFAPDDRSLLAAGSDGAVRLWDVGTSRVRHTLTGHLDKATCVAYPYTDSARAGSAGNDRALKIWDLAKGFCITSLMCHSSCQAVAFSRDGAALISGHFDGAVRIWDVKSGALAREIPGMHAQAVTSIAVFPAGDALLTAGKDHAVRVIDLRTFAAVRNMTTAGFRAPAAAPRVALSPDGAHAAAGAAEGGVYVWSAGSGALVRTLPGPAGAPVTALAWSPAGAPLAAAWKSGSILLYE